MKRKYNPEHRSYLQQHKQCELCLKETPLEIHHIIPLVAGGRDVYRNWIAICPQCHRKLTPSSELACVAKEKIRNSPSNFWIKFFSDLEKSMDIWQTIEHVENLTLEQNTFDYKENER